MHLAILETGLPPEPIRGDFPRYPDMFRSLLLPAAPDLQTTDFSVLDGAFPDIAAFDAFLITGSPAGVYENHDWLEGLFATIQAAAAADKPQVGICFGHQAIAQALGGRVVKSPKGWGLGRHHYTLVERPDWLAPEAPGAFALAVSHQDQIVDKPEAAQVFAQSEFAPYAALYYPDAPALTFQGHPEFNNAFAAALYNARRGRPLIDEVVDMAVKSLDKSEDNALIANWIMTFLRTHV